MKIGYNRVKYPEQRNIINKVDQIHYIQVKNYKLIVLNVFNKIKGVFFNHKKQISRENRFYFNDLNFNSVDVIHLFNYISYGKTPWVITFESIVPRSKNSNTLIHANINEYPEVLNDSYTLQALDQLAGPACKKIIALSQCALNMQKLFLNHFPEYYAKIESKLMCLHPPQNLFVKTWEEKGLNLDEDIHFMFVGGQFFGKGGREILKVFLDLKQTKQLPIKLTIISSLTPDTYASNTSEKDVGLVKRILDENKSWIKYHKYLPNQDVLALMKTAHVGLLPTYADTYGYSVLEFQASGCPVITTNVRALPEINNDEVGWLIPVRKHSSGEGYYASEEEREAMQHCITTGLKIILIDIMENKKQIIQKANNALKQIENNHSPDKFGLKMYDIYCNALKIK